MHPLLALTLREAPLSPGKVRVVVDVSRRTTHRDFDTLAQARAYADDVRREGEDPGATLVLLFDPNGERLGD